LVFLPLLITPLLLTAAAASFAARNGITGVATGFLRFKAEQLESYVRGQWDLLVANEMQGNARLVEAAQAGVGSFAAGLVRSPTELILAVDDLGRVVMSSAPLELSAPETEELSLLAEARARGWRELRLAGRQRVAQTFYFEPFHWLVLISEQADTFYRAVGQIYSQSGAITAVSLGVTLVLMLLFSRYLTRPLMDVVTVMRDIIASSDLSRRVEILYEDETGELGHTFNLMTGELEKAYAEIKGYALRAAIAERKERKIRNIFQKYVPKDVIEQFFASPEALLAGEDRELAILFSDVRGFTTISESLRPNQVVESLNRYFGAMVDIVLQRGGIVDKYIGDAVMAFYGAPVRHRDDAQQAVRSAFEMLHAVTDFNAWQHERGRPEFHIGIGINYGVVTVGNIGSEKKLDYTIIGDSVNLANRLEGLTKTYHEPIIISESVYRHVNKEFPCRMIDRVAVKGRTTGVTIYAPHQSLTSEEERAWGLHHSGLQYYYNREFDEASRRFAEVGRILPADGPSRIFLERARSFAMVAPPDGWNGIVALMEK